MNEWMNEWMKEWVKPFRLIFTNARFAPFKLEARAKINFRGLIFAAEQICLNIQYILAICKSKHIE